MIHTVHLTTQERDALLASLILLEEHRSGSLALLQRVRYSVEAVESDSGEPLRAERFDSLRDRLQTATDERPDAAQLRGYREAVAAMRERLNALEAAR